ncbi:MAG: RNA polymerase sigma factor [Eubacteriaceae bacterium]
MDSNLIKKCKNGDISSFEILVNEYSRKVYNIVFRIIGNEEDTKDISQEVFIKIYKKIKTFKEQSELSTWIYRIAVNCAKDHLKKRKENIFVHDFNQSQNNMLSNEDIPEDNVESKENTEILINALDRLKQEQREIIVLKDIQDFTYEEISKILKISLGTVKSRLSRSRVRLRSILLEMDDCF